MKRWFYHYPSMVYAGTAYGDTIKEARIYIRRFLGVDRLPRNTSIWRDHND
jgi:hypothetical protein